MSYCFDLPNSASIFGQWLFDWQTLISGFLAVIAAGFTVGYLRKQIRQSEEQEKGRLRRQNAAVRATLPLTLSGLTNTMRTMLDLLNKAKIEFNLTNTVENFHPPLPPTDAINELQQIILSSDKTSVTSPISEIIRQTQTLWARVELLSDQREQRAWGGLLLSIDIWMLQAAKIHTLIESLFDYARCETDEGPASVLLKGAEAILMRTGVHTTNLRDLIASEGENSLSFWPRS